MSLDPMLWALKDAPVADVHERMVLIALAERADPDGCGAYPSKNTIAAQACVDPKTVQRTLGRLRQRGLIALGDQAEASRIPARYRPTVWDLLIPYSWFPDPERINRERAQRGLPPLTPRVRPDLPPAPPRTRRSDAGKPRGVATVRGDYQSPLAQTRRSSRGDSKSALTRGDLQSTRGGTTSPAQGGLADPQTSPASNHAEQPPQPDPAPTAAIDGGLAGTPPITDPHRPAELADAARRILGGHPAWRAVGGQSQQDRLVAHVASLLASGWDEAGLLTRWRFTAQQATNPGGLLVSRVLNTPPLEPSALVDLPAWCGRCGTDLGDDRARTNVRFRVVDGEPCQDCHPAGTPRPTAADHDRKQAG